ncbi:MAG: AI-2E family transporter [Bryobacteraceae bacterium]|nr:AI-2E family transporter [Bryobacteraceae bacterium]
MSLLPASLDTGSTNARSASVIALGVLVALLYFGKLFWVTLMSAIVISLILEPFVQLFIRWRVPRGPASFLVCSLFVAGLYVLGVAAYTQVVAVVQDLPNYVNRVNDLGQAVVDRIEALERNIGKALPKRMQERPSTTTTTAPAAGSRKRRAAEPQPQQPPPVQEVRIKQDEPSLVAELYPYLGQIYDVALMASFVPFLVYFMLSWRDHIRRAFLQMFEGENRNEIGRSLTGVANMTRAYMAGNFVLGIVLSVVTTLLFLFMRLPFAVLVGPISGFLSLVPYVGLPLAVLPPLIAALPVYKTLPQYLILSTAVAFLHLIALNLLYPKVVGGRVHLNPLTVTIALMFWGLIWGGAGLVLAIPITAGIKAVCDNVSGLEGYGKLLGD